MSSPSPSQADRLKTEGNTLFRKKDLAGAYAKYTKALKYDDKNAILYSNRAACSLGLNRYLDASVDATKATDIDPGYAKAWARLAAVRVGLNRVDKAIDAWTRALGALPVGNLTPADQKQREQYSSELAAAKAKFEDLKANPKKPEGMTTFGPAEREKLPWKRAAAIIPDLIASQTWNSSAWVIERAYTSWEEAVNGMKQGHMRQTPAGPAYVGRCGVLENFSNALIEDSRVFHIADENFLSMYNQQMQLEMMMANAWSDGGPKEVIQEAPKRLEVEGWKSVRPALSVTVRGWMMRAFFENVLKNNIETALEFYTSAIEVLKWGAERWKDVPSEEKGSIFQPTFVRGVKCLRLDALMKACKQNPSKFPSEELLAKADEILSELADTPTEPHVPDIAFFLSFFRYPIGQAHSVRGFCLLEEAKRLRQANSGDLTRDISKRYLDASAEYLKAAASYPKDDENHAWFLHRAYHAQFDGGTTPKLLLFVLDMLVESVPMMKNIWEYTPQAFMGQHEALDADLKARENIQYGLETKQMELDSLVFSPQPGMAL